MSVEQWEKVSEIQPSDRFVCTYGGNFSQVLELNRSVIERFLQIGGLDGRVLLQESKVKKPQSMPDGLNPDGSLTGRGSLRFGQKLETDDKAKNPYIQVESDALGWTISINGGLITEDLTKKQGLTAREMTGQFGQKFNHFLGESFNQALIKDKFTFTKDPFFIGRLIGSGIIINFLAQDIIFQNWGALVKDILWSMFMTGVYNGPTRESSIREFDAVRAGRRSNILDKAAYFGRRNVASHWEVFALPLELDRAILAGGYLNSQRMFRHPLVQVSD